jgi:DNA-binding GntR family transcriptional regulator
MPPTVRRSAKKTAPRRGNIDTPDGAERLDHVSRAYQELRRIIIWGELPPGSRISERLVAERMRLSRTPVRSALHRLEQEGFVTSRGQGRERRLIVAPLTMADAQEVYSIVAHLEGLAARTAAALPPAQRKEIVRRLRIVNGELAALAHTTVDSTRFFKLDIEFHARYVEDVVGPRLLTLYRAIKPQSERYVRLYVSVLNDRATTSVREHETIIRSIARGDRDGAQHAAEMNWYNAAERLALIIEQHGERGRWHIADEEPSPALIDSTPSRAATRAAPKRVTTTRVRKTARA